MAVSDRARLRPEEIFTSETRGTMKGETEVTQDDRKRTRSKKKRQQKQANAQQPKKQPRSTAEVERSIARNPVSPAASFASLLMVAQNTTVVGSKGSAPKKPPTSAVKL